MDMSELIQLNSRERDDGDIVPWLMPPFQNLRDLRHAGVTFDAAGGLMIIFIPSFVVHNRDVGFRITI